MRKYTKEEKIENRRRNKVIGIITSIFVGMFLCITGYFIWNILKLKGIEDILRYIGIGILVIICILVVRHNFSLRSQPKKYRFIVFILVLIAFGVGEYFASSFISKAISTLDNMNKNTTLYTTKLITLKDSGTTKKNIKKKKIGIISDEDSIEGYILAQNIIKEQKLDANNIYDYDEEQVMLKALYDGEIDACFVVGNYVQMYKNNISFEHIEDETKVLFKYSKEMETKESKTKKKKKTSVTEPFTILVMGVDSNDDEIGDDFSLGDTLILITFNPKTLNATIFSIPRDTFVQITCAGNRYSKITHANPYGSECVKETVENFTGIHIDYYAKMNFKGVISLVDALGGIDVYVPYGICENNQYRSFSEVIFVDAGQQHLTGVQALALARNRKAYDWCGPDYTQGERNDFVRGQNQQLVIKGIINAAKNIRTVDQFYQVLDAVGKTLETDLTREQMLEFYNIFKDVLLSTDSLTDMNDVISMQRTYLTGSDGHLHDYLVGSPVYEFLPSMNSLNAITKAMKVNLGLEEEEYETSFSFSMDEPYEPKIIGKDVYGGIKNYPQPEAKPETKTCTAPLELGADGQTCICPKSKGYKEDSSGKCVKADDDDDDEEITCENATVVEGKCVCWAGYEKDSNGNCVKSAEPDDSGSSSGDSGESSGGEDSSGEDSGGESGGDSGESGGEDSGN
jgi:LCP family protein required for cell wall assembly